MTASGPFWALMATRAGLEALDAWDIDTAAALADAISSAGFEKVASPLADGVERARQEMATTDPMIIGALLPLSGKNSGVGAMMKAGIETALRILGAEHEFDVVFLDTASDPDLARQQLRELKFDHHAIAAIGPATGPTATAVAKEADELKMPVLTLSLKPGLPATSEWVFRHFTTHQAEADALARWAVVTSGIKHVAVIHPDTVYGKQMAEMFTRTAQDLGAQVDLTLSFDPAESNFVPLASQIAAAPSVEAIFVPVTAQQLDLIGPALAYEKVWAAMKPSSVKDERKVVLLAPQVAYSPSHPVKAGKFLQGTVFATGFWAETSDPFASFFVSEFERDSDTTVNVYHAYAADALFILAQGVVVGGARTREQLRAWLSDPSRCSDSIPTVSSFAGFDDDGESIEPVELIRLVKTGFTPLAAQATTP
jgi:branched-chain amino acid transport system substrate-binding protein